MKDAIKIFAHIQNKNDPSVKVRKDHLIDNDYQTFLIKYLIPKKQQDDIPGYALEYLDFTVEIHPHSITVNRHDLKRDYPNRCEELVRLENNYVDATNIIWTVKKLAQIFLESGGKN